MGSCRVSKHRGNVLSVLRRLNDRLVRSIVQPLLAGPAPTAVVIRLPRRTTFLGYRA